MANLTTIEKQILENLFQMNSGYVLNFTDRTIAEFFRDDIGVDIFAQEYNYASGSKANRMRGFWLRADDRIVARSIQKLLEYIHGQISLGYFKQEDFPVEIGSAAKDIADRLLGVTVRSDSNVQATFVNGNINIVLRKEVFTHVQELLNSGHYFNAVEEAFKIVRKKLKDITGKEKATDAFSGANFEKIFGNAPADDVEKDFFEGVKFLHMAIQFLRNEKAHTPARTLDRNLAIHYISLASLAYDLITRK